MKSVIVVMLLIITVIPCSVRTSEETSDLYLRNVVEELQFLNGVVPSERSTRVSYPTYDDLPTISETNEVEATSSDIITNLHHLPPPPLSPVKGQRVRKPSATYYTEPPQPPPLQQQQSPPMILGFTASELASMYRKAIESGGSIPMKHSNNDNIPQFSYDGTKVMPALRVQSPGYGPNYAYYFYPLNSFRHELEKQTQTANFPPGIIPDGYHTLPDSAYASTTMIDHVKKEPSNNGIMNHIITGVSSFIGMAIFFIFSMFIYPRFLHIMHFPFVATSRTNFRNEFGHLAAFVTEAIDTYNQNTRKKSKHLPQR